MEGIDKTGVAVIFALILTCIDFVIYRSQSIVEMNLIAFTVTLILTITLYYIVVMLAILLIGIMNNLVNLIRDTF